MKRAQDNFGKLLDQYMGEVAAYCEKHVASSVESVWPRLRSEADALARRRVQTSALVQNSPKLLPTVPYERKTSRRRFAIHIGIAAAALAMVILIIRPLILP